MLTIAISSRSLFSLEKENEIFEREGQQAFDDHMQRTESELLEPGAAFALVSKLLALNSARGDGKRDRVEVVLLSRNSCTAGMRVMNSVHQHGLDISQSVFTGGGDRFRYAHALDADLFLCTEPSDAKKALDIGVAAASLIPGGHTPGGDDIVRIAFDGDAVLFSGESDDIFREHGLASFIDNELLHAAKPLGAGPFKRLLTKLCDMQRSLPPQARHKLHIGLVTARGMPSHARPIMTLRSWGLSVNELILAAGRPKGPLLRAFGADMFFDDTGRNIDSACKHGILAGRVHTDEGGGIVAD